MCLGRNGQDQVVLKLLGITRILGETDKYYGCKVLALVSGQACDDQKQESASKNLEFR